MSSIFGKINIDKKPIVSGELSQMLNELNHWNADETNIWMSGEAGFGHLMLFNSPESLNEKLPLYDNECQLCVTADARIYNRDELYHLIQITTPEEKQISDSQIILLLYKKYGKDCIKYLIGDFAFAIWDERERKLFCARDQMGVKPFFYYNREGYFAFASAKKGLLCLPGIDKSINKEFFYNQILPRPIQASDTTIYKHIHRLPPAHILTWYAEANKFELGQYWTLDVLTEIKFKRKQDYSDGLLYLFETAVRSRLRSIYPIGAQLSGGLDSSGIIGIASHLLKSTGKQLITFSNTYNAEQLAVVKDDPSVNERKYMDAVIEFNGIKDAVFVTENIWNDPVEEAMFALKIDDGLEMWSQLWLAPLTKAAMLKNVRTMFSGYPGDEMVTYRGQFYYLDYLDKKQYLKYFSAKKTWRFNKLKPFLSPQVEFFLHKIRNIFTVNSQEIRALCDFFKVPAKGRYAKGDVAWDDIYYRERFNSYRHFQKYRLLKPQVALRMESETRFGLAFRSEPCYPMADIRLTQYYLSMPNDIKHEGVIERSIYRAALQKYLPEMVLRRNDKTGIMAPFMRYPESLVEREKVLFQVKDDFLKKLRQDAHHKSKINYDNTTYGIKKIKWFEENFENLL